MKILMVIASAFVSGVAAAHTVTANFPDGATPLTADALKSEIEGREFTAKPADGPVWRLKYGMSGDFSVKAGTFSDEGTWSTSESAVCTEGKKLKSLCNSVRIKDGKLFMQRKGGEVMQLIPA